MHSRWLLLLALLVAAPAAAQVGPAQPPPAGDATRTIRLGLARLPPIVAVDFQLPSIENALLGLSFTDWVARFPLRVERAANASLRARRRLAHLAPTADTVAYLPPLVVPDTVVADDPLLGSVVGQYADIGLRVTGLGELGGSWTRYQPCDPSLYVNCNPGLFPQIEPNVEFGVQVGGTISDRIHVNVDYDQRREDFSAANNINVFYQGLPDEVLQRVEVGDVSIRLPTSRYLTRGIPAGNFGLMTSGQLGPIDFQTVWAQQRGDVSTREFRLASGGASQGLVQDDRIVLDDAGYVEGQFFFLVDPFALSGAPHVDVLALQAFDAPAVARPAQGGTLQLFRDERAALASGPQQAQLGLFLADAVSADGTLKHTGQFRRLVQDEDYLVHASGLWIMLRSPLRPDEALALSYVTEGGETIGTLDPEATPAGTTPALRLLRSPVATHQPGRPTWDYEMHQVYRLNASSDVELQSLDLRVSLGDEAGGRTFVNVTGAQVPFLKLFGLDEDAPADLIDVAQVWQPNRDREAQSGSRINGTFIVFPTLRPFLEPPPVPTANLTAAAARAALGGDANDVIYTNPDPVLRAGGTRFRLNFTYRVRVEGLVQSFNLGQFGIREGSERILFGGNALERDIDYTIDYEIGIVTLADPASLFGANPGAELRATWEQKSLFDIAPTTVFGANARYRLGAFSELNFVGIYQSEKTLYSRPQLGVEPGAMFLGGASARLDLGGEWLDRVLGGVPGLRLTAPSRVALDGELAFSLPNPNRVRQAYLDDFEGTDEVALDVRRQQWKLGSRPAAPDGDEGVLPVSPDAASAARLVWQHDYTVDGAVGGNLLPQRDIDNQIQIAGNQLPEPVMRLTFADAGTPPGERVWRALTTVLSTTGRDMTRSEYLELYVRAGSTLPLALVVDIGTVAEDAFYIDDDRRTNGTFPDGAPWGLGLPDEEASLARREVWGPEKDARGLWDQPCVAEPLTPYPLGDARANCTRGNGLNDTEDTDGNGIVETDDGAYFRYVIQLDRISPFLERDTVATGTGFRLYRIPLRTGAGSPVNGANEGTWRFIKHLRLTVAGEPGGEEHLELARMRIVGSRWTKRDLHGVVRGLLDDEAGAGAGTTEVRAGPVSQLTDGTSYSPPPGVREQLQDPTTQYGAAGIEFNEKSQRIAYDGLQADERAEIYLRYPQQPRNFLTYRQLRLWAVARAGAWGENGGERLLVKLGTDARNYYLFQTKLRPATGNRPVSPTDWTPEIVLDVGRWLELKALAEEALIRAPATAQVVLWSADSSYAVVLEDRARAPNLAAIRELTFAVYNAGPAAAMGEVWIDDLRLDAPDQEPGMAGNVNLSITGDFLSASIGYASRGSLFRQLNEDPSYQQTGDLSIATRAQLDRFLPASWGFDLPLTVTHTRSGSDPVFLERSDVRADRLDGLRETDGGITRVGLSVAKRTPSANPLVGLVLNGLTLRLGWNSASTSAITNRSEASGLDGGLDWRLDVARRDFDAVPGFVERFLRIITPAPLEGSDAFQRLLGARLRWTPEGVGFGTSYYDQESRTFRYDRILIDSADAGIRAVESPRHGLENDARLAFAPFEAISASVAVRSSRDLLDPGRATNQPLERAALEKARARLAGADIGWETNRSLTTGLVIRPRIANWIRPSWTYSNRFASDRNPSYLEVLGEGADTSAQLQRRFGSDKQVGRRLDLQPAELFRTVYGEQPDSARTLLYRLGQALQTLSLSWNDGVGSLFERESFQPGVGYQFGLGGFERFRTIEEDTSASALARDDIRLSSGIGVPLGGLLAVGYTETSSESFDARGGRRTQSQTGWPTVRLDWRQIPLPATWQRFLVAASIGGGYEHVERSSLYGHASSRRGGVEDRFPLDLTLSFPHGLTAAYTAALATGTSTDPTGDAEQDRVNHSFRFTGRFQPPAFLGDRFASPLQTSLLLSHDAQRQCRFAPGADAACVPFLDLTTRSANLTLDTVLSDLVVGLRLTWTDRQNHVGTRTGNSQFQLGLFGQFNFSAGALSAIPGGGFPAGIPR
jgi:hypothetical protein